MPPKKKSPRKQSPRKKASPRGRARKPQARKSKDLQTRTLLAFLGVLGFLVLSLILLSQIPHRPQPSPAKESVRTPEVDGEVLKVAVKELLAQNHIDQEKVRVLKGAGGVRELRIDSGYPSMESLDFLKSQLARIPGNLRLELSPESMAVRIFEGGALLYALTFHPERLPPPPASPKVAIIMDDLGQHLSVGRTLLDLDLNVTWSILPGNSEAVALAELGAHNGREIMVHIPMEPKGYPMTNPGGDALLCSQTASEVRRRTDALLDRLPQVTGGNNHMGSRFSEDPQRMRIVLEEMKRRGLFFVDSLTSAGSIGYREARKADIPAAVRDVFLDNEQNVGYISAQIRTLARLAQKRGSAIGICHPHPTTLEALREMTPTLKKMGVEVVPVSRLLTR